VNMRQLVSRTTSVRSLMTKTISRLREGLGSSNAVEPRKPIRYLTENGFSIVRRCDLDASISASGQEHRFVVRDPDDYDLEITVEISDRAFAEVVSRSRGRLTFESTYWIACAERHLATYLWEHGDYPPDGSLTVDYLTPEDVDLARRWKDEPSPPSTQDSAQAHSVHTLNTQRLTDDSRRPQRQTQPIKLLTENGYSIVRVSDIDSSATDNANLCRFIVQDPTNKKRDICVSFDDQLIADIQRRRRNLPLSMQSKYWLVCAESQLATYLWEHNQFPPEANLKISDLSGDELLMAQHWRDAE